MATRKRSRSPHRGDRRSNVRRRYVPLHYDYPKFKYSPEKNESNAINQLTADALYKQIQRSNRPRITYDSEKGAGFKPKPYREHSSSRYRSDLSTKYNNDKRDDVRPKKNDKPEYKDDNVFNAPRSGYYFEHDNRQFDNDRNHRRRDSYGVSRRMVERSPNKLNGSHSKKYSHSDKDKLQTRHSDRTDNTQTKYKEKDRSGGFWQHDKFEEVDKDGNNNKP